ncbi:hypothetical protein [Streptomyces sp. NPDC018833]|uniref:hypothetical protein n=1 Tax=Streptomyces sp. NPDC018833 TaxID=3365053 RepID=UPI0037BD95FB
MNSAACGLPVGSIHWHFSSKDVHVAVLERARTALPAALSPGKVPGAEAAQRPDLLAAVEDAFQRHHPQSPKPLLGCAWCSRPPVRRPWPKCVTTATRWWRGPGLGELRPGVAEPPRSGDE